MGYKWKTVFNTFGAPAIAAEAFGLQTAIVLRIVIDGILGQIQRRLAATKVLHREGEITSLVQLSLFFRDAKINA